jgi:hypothetical protein
LIIGNDSNTFANFKINAGRTVKFTNSTTQTLSSLTALGTSGSHIVISNTSSTTKANLIKSGGVVTGCDYIDFTNIAATPATLKWYVGPNSTSTTSTGLILSNPPTIAKVSGVAIASIAKIQGVAIEVIGGVNGIYIAPSVGMKSYSLILKQVK